MQNVTFRITIVNAPSFQPPIQKGQWAYRGGCLLNFNDHTGAVRLCVAANLSHNKRTRNASSEAESELRGEVGYAKF